ncbi:MAG: hypothetical protein ACFFB2_20455 [Promethearchaeota archaeon]
MKTVKKTLVFTTKDFELVCQKCGEEWIRRTERLPKKCPKCGSRRWNEKQEEK